MGGGGGGGGGYSNCNAMIRKTAEPLRGGGRLKFKKINAGKTIKSTPKKKLTKGSPVICTFHSPPIT